VAIHFSCRRCRHALSVRRRQAGSPIICPNCKGETLAPSASETSRPAPVAVPPMTAPAIMEPPRLGIPVPRSQPAPRPRPVAISVPVAEPVPVPMELPTSPTPRRHILQNRRLRAGVAAAASLLVVAGLLAYNWHSQPTSPEDEVVVASDAAEQTAEDDPGELLAALAPGEEEWLDERPIPDGPEDPAQPVLGPAPAIDIPEPPAAARAVVPPLPAPGAVATFKRRQSLAEEDLRKQLARAPEIGLERSKLPALVWEHKEQQETGLAFDGVPDLNPRPLYDLYPAVKGLSIRHGREAQLDSRRAATLDTLSRKLRVYVSHFAPADREGKRAGAALLRQVMYAEMRGPKPEWLRPEAIPVLMQMLTAEEVVLRRLLVEILTEIKHQTATTALAQRAVCDLDADIRAFAIESLKARPRDEYRDVLLRALRHPLPMLADHAAEALVALQMREAVPALVTMLKAPDPALPYPGKDGRPLVREVVRTNHLANCLLCHPPSVTYTDPVPGVVPNARWLYPVVSITPTLVERAGLIPINGKRPLHQTPVIPIAPARPVAPPPPGPSPGPASNPGPGQQPTQPTSPKAQQVINFVNSVTSQTTTTGTTKQTGCHDYTASTNLVNLVTVPATPPPKSGGAKNKPSGPPPVAPVVKSGGPPPLAPVAKPSGPPRPLPVASGGKPNTPPRFVPGPGRGPLLGVKPVVQIGVVFEPDVTVVNLPLVVRGDVTYLRQDFSVQQPVLDVPGQQPTFVNMRFDYLVRIRRASADEERVAKEAAPGRTYEQREAVLFALRELTGRDAGDTTEAWQRQCPDAELDSQAERLAGDLVRAEGTARQQALARLRDGKGPVYTDALAAAVGRLDSKAQDQAREALVARLTRMTAATLRNKFAEESSEIRRAAALACGRKEDVVHVADLITLLDDREAAVSRAAGQALGTLTGQDFSTAQQWKDWWEKQ
jgi:HEAT repeat protein